MPEATYIRCPNCGQKYNVPPERREKYAGKKITCKKCQQSFVVPPLETGDQPIPAPVETPSNDGNTPAPAATARPAPPRRPSVGSRRPPGHVEEEEVSEYKPTPLWQQEAKAAAQPDDAVTAAGFKKPLFDESELSSVPDTMTATTPGAAPAAAPARPRQAPNRMARLSVILGAIVIIPLCSIAAIVCGFLGYRESRRRGPRDRTAVTAQLGVVLGLAGLVLCTCLYFFVWREYRQGQESAVATACRIQIRQVGDAINAWAQNHNGQFPDSLADMILDKSLDPKLLLSPGEKGKPIDATNRAGIEAQLSDPSRCSYKYLGKGWTLATINKIPVLIENAPHHGPEVFVLLGDNTVRSMPPSPDSSFAQPPPPELTQASPATAPEGP